MNSERKGKNIVIGLLCATIVFMGIGFAALSSVLTINGTANVANTWNVQITDITVTDTTGKADAGTPTHNATTANFEATLNEPGDSVTYEVTVTNGGSINAVLASVDPVFTNAEDDAIVYTLADDNPTANAKLASGATHTFVVTATYKADATGEKAPSADKLTKSFSLQLTYNQDPTA
ncbi:MAG: hypothetical protein ACI4OT_02305 [Bacilli bacterium]